MFEAFFTILIVQLTFLGVGQDFVGFTEIFEFFGGVRVVSVLVWTNGSVIFLNFTTDKFCAYQDDV